MGPSSWRAHLTRGCGSGVIGHGRGRRGPPGARKEPGRAPAWDKEEVMAIFSARAGRAVAVALRAHRDQLREGDGPLAYSGHPITVAPLPSPDPDAAAVMI